MVHKSCRVALSEHSPQKVARITCTLPGLAWPWYKRKFLFWKKDKFKLLRFFRGDYDLDRVTKMRR